MALFSFFLLFRFPRRVRCLAGASRQLDANCLLEVKVTRRVVGVCLIRDSKLLRHNIVSFFPHKVARFGK